MNAKGIVFVPDVYPGFNDTLNDGVSPPWVVLPRDVSSFEDMLRTALNYRNSSLGIVMITSWNEWMEGTVIEPSMKEDEAFLNVVYDAVVVPSLSVPEFPSYLILPLFMIATLMAELVLKKKRKDI
jgi:hypothetical protein